MFVQNVSYSAALVAGLLSFLSPCILPLIPAYFTFITGFSLEELTGGDPSRIRWKVLWSTLAFIAGFSFVFVAEGASASFLGGLLFQYQDFIRILGGIVVVILGLHVAGIFRLGFLDFEKRLHLQKKPVHILGTIFVGMAFGAGWTPCVGPLLGSILALAATQDNVGQGVILLSIYSAGLALPFLILSLFAHLVLSFVRRGVKILKYVNAVAGLLLVALGALLIADKLRVVV